MGGCDVPPPSHRWSFLLCNLIVYCLFLQVWVGVLVCQDMNDQTQDVLGWAFVFDWSVLYGLTRAREEVWRPDGEGGRVG